LKKFLIYNVNHKCVSRYVAHNMHIFLVHILKHVIIMLCYCNHCALNEQKLPIPIKIMNHHQQTDLNQNHKSHVSFPGPPQWGRDTASLPHPPPRRLRRLDSI